VLTSDRAREVAGQVTVATAALALGLPALQWPANTLDEMILLVYPLRMAGGDLPYRDFFAAYGPTHWYLLEGAYSLFGGTLLVARAVGLAIHVLLALASYALLRPAGRAAAVLGGLLTAVMVFSLGDAPYAWLLAASLCLWQVVLLRRPPAWCAGLGGLVGGLALSVRPDVLPLVALPALVVLWGRERLRPWGVGLAAGALPLVYSFVRAPGAMVEDIVLGRAGRGAGQSRLPWWPENQAARGLALVLVCALACLLVQVALRRSRESLLLLVLAVATVPQALQRVDSPHLIYAGVLFLPALPAVVRSIGAHFGRDRPALLSAGMALVIVGIAGSSLYPLAQQLSGDGPRSSTLRHDGRSLLVVARYASTEAQLLSVVDAHSTPGETLFVFDEDLVQPAVNDVSLYYLLPGLRSHAKHVEVTPGVSSARGSGLREDVLRADILVLIRTTPSFRHDLFPFERPGSTEAADALRAEFCVLAEIDYYVVYRRC